MKTITKNLLIVMAMITTVMIIGCPQKVEPKAPARYTVMFDKNHADAKGSMDPQTFVEGVEQKLTPNLFDLTNHEFKGWALKPDGDKKYIDQQSITVSSNMTLYAVWEEKICTITFNKNADDAVGTMYSQTINNGVPGVLSENKFTRENFEFLGWATSPDGEKVYDDKSEITVNRSMELYAVWKEKICSITFNKNADDVDGTMDTQTTENGVTCILSENKFTRQNFEFLGWATSPDGEKVYDDKSEITVNRSTELYAVWVRNIVYVTFDKNDQNATGTMEQQSFGAGISQSLNLNTFENDSYYFVGWAESSGGAKVYDDGESITITSNITLYAVWVPNKYTVTFEANGGTGTMEPQSFEHGVSQNLLNNAFTRENYTFVGWGTSPTGEKVYDDGESITITSSTTLYALWKPTAYVTFDKNDSNATGEMDQQIFGVGTAQSLRPNTFKNAGYNFTGWAFSPKGEKVYDDEASITITSNTTLYAVWEINKKVTVTHWQQNLVDDGYTEVVADRTEYDVQSTKEFTPSANTYTGFTVKTTPIPITVNGDMTIPIYYNREIYTLTLSDFDASYFSGHESLIGARLEGNTLIGRYGAEINALNDSTKINREKNVFLSWTPAIPNTLTGNNSYKANWEFFEMKTGSEIRQILGNLAYNHYSFVPSNFPPSTYAENYTKKLTTNNSDKHCYVWKDENSSIVYYYADGYTNGSKLIPLNSDSSRMFWYLYFANIDLSKFNTSNVTDMSYMFENCNLLTSLDLSNFDTSKVTNMSGMFNDCSGLTSLDLSNFGRSNVTDMSYMFSNCTSLTSLDLSNFDTSKVTSMYAMFSDCSGLTSLDLSNFDTSNVTDMRYMFHNCTSLNSLNLSNFGRSNVTDMSYMFSNCTSLTSLDLSNFDTSKVTSMSGMFEGCSGLTSLDLSGFDTSSVDYMGGMFKGCSSLTSLDLSNFDTSKVTSMSSMFEGCSGLTSLDLSGFDTSSVDYMGGMFSGCRSLTSLELSNFDTSNVVIMEGMFLNCRSLTSLELSNFDTSNVVIMEGMFLNCRSLTSLDLSSFDTSSVAYMGGMFCYCTELTTIYVKQYTAWPNCQLDSDERLFYECTNLVGGNGTKWEKTHDWPYARVDGLDGKPGYFTAK